MQDVKLIRSVKRYQFLYDVAHPHYTDIENKDKAWKQISEYLQQPASACKHRWRKLRDSFRRALNKKRSKAIHAGKMKKWTHEEEMSFLQPYLILRGCDVTNDEFVMLDGQSSQPSDVETPVDSDNRAQVTWRVDMMKTDENVINSHTENVAYDTQSNVWNELTNYGNINEDCVSDTSSTIHETMKERRLKVKKSDAQLLNSAAMLAQLLKRNDSNNRDEIDEFFMNMATTVKKFAPYSQAVAKNKIFTLVSRCELEHLASLTQ